MKKYHPVNLDLVKNQIVKLLKGQGVRLKHSQIGRGSVVMHLTKSQANKMDKAYRSGKGLTIKFHDTPHMKYNVRHGSGFLDVLKSVGSTLWNIAKPLVKKIAPSLLGDVAQTGIEKLGKTKVGKKLEQYGVLPSGEDTRKLVSEFTTKKLSSGGKLRKARGFYGGPIGSGGILL
jgi:hypothetical protein